MDKVGSDQTVQIYRLISVFYSHVTNSVSHVMVQVVLDFQIDKYTYGYKLPCLNVLLYRYSQGFSRSYFIYIHAFVFYIGHFYTVTDFFMLKIIGTIFLMKHI